MNSPFEKLPKDKAELERQWPVRLTRILEDIQSPANPSEVIDTLRNNDRFMALINGWENMPSASQANASRMIDDTLWEAARDTRAYCIRCGECCRRGSPTLYEQDRPVLRDGHVRRRDLVTLRKGERAWSNRRQKTVTLEAEQVKIRTAPGTNTCIFLGPGSDACLIYEHRPHMCRIMECWDSSRFDTLADQPISTRLALLGDQTALADIIARHDDRCPPSAVYEFFDSCDGDEVELPEELLDMVLFDRHVREFAVEKLGLKKNELDFWFGRPLPEICLSAGYAFKEESGDRPILVRIQSYDQE